MARLDTTEPMAQATGVSTDNGEVYATFEHTFVDSWTKTEKDFSFRFSKPNKAAIRLFQKAASRDATNASRNMLVNHIHPEEKTAFLAAIDEYPAIVTSYIGAVMKGVGLADLGN